MAKLKKAVPAKSSKSTKTVKKAGRPSEGNGEKIKGKPVVVILPKKLHARCKLGCIALSTNFSTVVRELLEEWVKNKQKAIAGVINMTDVDDDIDEDEEETETDESEDEDEETEDEESDEDEDEEEDEDDDE